MKFAPQRKLCHSCKTKQARGVPTAPSAPALPPLEAAQKAHVEQRQARDLRAEHKALLEENERLRTLVGEASKLKGPEIIVYKERKEQRSDAIANAVASD